MIHEVQKAFDDGAAISTPHDNSAKSRLLACSRASPDVPAVAPNGAAFAHITQWKQKYKLIHTSYRLVTCVNN
jgi:hypothetical protein